MIPAKRSSEWRETISRIRVPKELRGQAEVVRIDEVPRHVSGKERHFGGFSRCGSGGIDGRELQHRHLDRYRSHGGIRRNDAPARSRRGGGPGSAWERAVCLAPRPFLRFDHLFRALDAGGVSRPSPAWWFRGLRRIIGRWSLNTPSTDTSRHPEPHSILARRSRQPPACPRLHR